LLPERRAQLNFRKPARRLRHFLRRAYAVDLDPTRLGHNVERLRRAAELTEPSMTGLFDSLALAPRSMP
jgi:hypothetical protein